LIPSSKVSSQLQELNTLKQVDMATLQKDPEAMRLAKNTFSQYCQSCHGKDGKGQTNFPIKMVKLNYKIQK
jgi:mono/diheme cytochrome c family protein